MANRAARQAGRDGPHVTEQYDSFIERTKWPDDEERDRLARVYGWPEPVHPQSSGVPQWVPEGPLTEAASEA